MSPRHEGAFDGLKRIAKYKLHAATILVSLLAVWFVTRPYVGIVGDARFYAMQGLATLSPEAFAGDLFLAGGDKAPGSIYLFFYTSILARFGLGTTNLLLVLIGGALWAGGAYYLATGMMRSRALVIWAVALTLALPSDLSFIAVGEPIVTPRLFAEALSLYAIGFVLRGQSILSLSVVGIAFLLHPLMALPAAALIVFYLGCKRPALFAWALLPAVVVLLLIFYNVGPFSLGRQTFDEAWLAELRIREYSVFLQNWNIVAWLPALDTLFLTCICLVLAEPEQRRLIWSIVAVVVTGFTIAFIGGDLLHNVLIFDLQLWRSAWLLIIVTHMLTAQALCAASSRVSIRVKFLIAVAVILWGLARFIMPLLLLSVPAMALAAIVLILSRLIERQPKALSLALTYAYAVILTYFCFLSLIHWASQMQHLADNESRHYFFGMGLLVSAFAGIGLLVSAFAVVAIVQRSKTKNHASPVTSLSQFFAALIILAFAISQWDHRPKWTKFVEDASAAPASLTALLPAGSLIYWDGDVTVPWFLLRRGSYFSCDQGAAILFSRESAMLFAQRYRSFGALDSLDYQQGAYCPPISSGSDAISAGDSFPQKPRNESEEGFEVAAICAREPGLGAIVLTRRLTEDPSGIWNSPVPFKFISSRAPVVESSETSTFYIYDCKRETNNGSDAVVGHRSGG
jgi:hypothetical protein